MDSRIRAWFLFAWIVGTAPALAQSIADLSVDKNAGNSADQLVDALGDRHQRKTTVSIDSSSSTSFTARYAEIVGADVDQLTLGQRTETQASDYTVSFEVTAPGAYYLTVDTNLTGALTLHDDGSSASADASAVTGQQTGGTLSSGSSSLSDPGALSGSGGGNTAETCTGASGSCPSDTLVANGVECRAAAGACDVAETCGGATTTCPADVVAAAGTVCRPVADACDAAEACSGTSAACPTDPRPFDADADGTCDADDSCPTTSNPFQSDGDGDGLGDACDPCTNMVPIFTDTAKLRLTRVLAPSGDDKLRLVGTMRLTPPLQSKLAPLTYGMRVLVVTKDGRTVLDVTRAGWTSRGNGRSFVYRNRGDVLLGGIHRVMLRRTGAPGGVRFVVRGKLGAYAASAGELPLRATVILDAPFATTGACAETPTGGACAARGGGSSIRCRW